MLTFLLFLANQYRLYISAPSLSVEQPIEGAVISQESILVEGHTDNDAVVEINNKKIAVTRDGNFSTRVTLTPGINTVVIESISKYGKRTTVTRTLSVQPNG